mmetsp:Transcript_89239/g.277469  ORF Transcript_89239/g.277469 Transcript_89239/m.277469 type:complete len:356 (+) Transcript_89239:2050-3117(+)
MHLGEVHRRVRGRAGRLGLGLPGARRRREGGGRGDGGGSPLQDEDELGKALARQRPLLEELEEGGLQLPLVLAGVELRDEARALGGEVLLRGEPVPLLHAADDLLDRQEELAHLLGREGQVRGEAVPPDGLLEEAAEGVQGSELVRGPDKLVEVVPPLRVDDAVDLRPRLLLVDTPEPAVEEGWVRHCRREGDERAGNALHAMLPLRAALLLADAVHLVEHNPPQALHPVLVGRGQEQHLQDVGDGHQDLAILPLAGLHDAACRVELLQEDAQELVLGVGRVSLAGEARVDLRADLVDEGLGGGHVHGDPVVVGPKHRVHDVVADERLPAGVGRRPGRTSCRRRCPADPAATCRA